MGKNAAQEVQVRLAAQAKRREVSSRGGRLNGVVARQRRRAVAGKAAWAVLVCRYGYPRRSLRSAETQAENRQTEQEVAGGSRFPEAGQGNGAGRRRSVCHQCFLC